MGIKIVKENSFEGAPGGGSGTLSYGNTYGTPGGGDTIQDPNHFAHAETPMTGSVQPARPDRVSSSGAEISPAVTNDQQKAQVPLSPDQMFDPQVDKLFKKKITPSADEIMCGLQAELGKMVHKDKVIAKQTVLKNLKQDPNFYSRLGSLNINDKDMKIDEQKETTFDKTKNLLDQMILEKKQSVQQPAPYVEEIMKDMWNKRYGYKDKE